MDGSVISSGVVIEDLKAMREYIAKMQFRIDDENWIKLRGVLAYCDGCIKKYTPPKQNEVIENAE